MLNINKTSNFFIKECLYKYQISKLNFKFYEKKSLVLQLHKHVKYYTYISRAQQNYNSAHTRTRAVIERCFGWWKRRFMVLHGEIKVSKILNMKVVMNYGYCNINYIINAHI